MSVAMRVAIVGGASLKGRELAGVLKERNFPARDIRLLDDEESLGQIEAVGDEVTFVQSVSPEHFEGVDVAFFATDEKFTRRHWTLAHAAGAAIVDLSYGMEIRDEAVVRSPWLERELGRTLTPELQPPPAIVAHPAAVVLSLLLVRAQKMGPVKTVAATIIEPASEQGRRGMDELHEQTVSLLSFRELPKQVFDSQVAFNTIARYGEAAQPALETIEHRIVRHMERITAGIAPSPAVLLLQGPSFHAHTFAVYVEMENATTIGDVGKAMSGDHLVITQGAEDAPSNVNAAGQDQVLLTIRRDEKRDKGFWLWAAADNLRLLALNAAECAETVVVGRPHGKVQ
jgi:aspartate-semialdehyde dehydrogenase